MAIPHAKPGEVVDVRPLGSALASAQTKTVVRAEQVEVIRLVVPAGKEIPEHKAKGEIVVQCLEGDDDKWDDDKSLTILRNCRRAMGQGGKLLIVEGVVPPGNEPSVSKFFDLAMMVLPGGM